MRTVHHAHRSATEARQNLVAAHQNALVDVVAGVDGREGSGNSDPDTAPLFSLNRGLPRRAGSLAESGHDDFEVVLGERIALEDPLAIDDQAGIGLACDVLRPVVETDPGRGHDIGVDVQRFRPWGAFRG